MAARSSKNEKFNFGLRSTSDDQPSDLSDESPPKCEKMATKLSENEMQFMHPIPQMRWRWDRNGMGMGQGLYRCGTGMGQGWDRYCIG